MVFVCLIPIKFNVLKRICFLILTFSFICNITFSQEKLRCKIIDITTKKPIVYATIVLKKNHRGTHADSNGLFEIPIGYKETGVIRISSIGYKTKEVRLANLKNNDLNIIYISVANNVLKEVVIKTSRKKKRKLLAREIVKNAIDQILENYPTEAHSYAGYYRDYQQPVGDSYQKITKSTTPIKYLNVHEAIIESFDDGFDSDKLNGKKNQSLLYKYKTNKDFKQDSTLTIPYDNKNKKYSETVYITPLGGNELNILNLTNSIRNYDKMSFSYTNIFQKDFLQNHTFKVKKIIYSDKTPLYEISFFSISEKTSNEFYANGSIYISKQDFAIHKFNYNLFYQFKEEPQYTVTIEYRQKKDKMYLNYITFNNYFEARNGNYFKIDKTIFNSKKNAFKISFNRQIDLSSLEPFRRNFKIYYKNEKLKIIDVNPFDTDSRTVTAYIDKKSIAKIDFEKEKDNPNYRSYFTFEVANIKDFNGYKVNERKSIKMNQYREFFVQEVFDNKTLPIEQNFIDKRLPLSESKITPLELENDYWMNTPLKVKKGN